MTGTLRGAAVDPVGPLSDHERASDAVRRERTRPRDLPALTGVRFVAAFAVLLFHYGATFLSHAGAPAPVSRLMHNGYMGVSLFFVISGFILTYVHAHDTVDGAFLRRFFISRFARIYPVYLLALLAGLAVLAQPLAPLEALRVLAMVQSWTPPASGSGYLWVMQAWTLSVEFFFYLAFPLLLTMTSSLSLRTAGRLLALCAVLIVSFGLSSVTPDAHAIGAFPATTWLLLPLLRLPEFAFGMLLCRLDRLAPRLAPAVNGDLAQCLVAALIVATLALAQDTRLIAVATVLIGVLIVQLSRGGGLVARLLSTRPFVLLGGASYALYLFQGPLRSLCDRFVPHPWDRIASPVVTFTVAIAVFLLWEQPVRIWLLRRLNRAPRPVEAFETGEPR